MATRDTKVRTVEAAVRLFNERGTAAVSTNHIAAEAGISPGNLYYHFRDKEAIIRSIFERVDAVWEVSYALPVDREPTAADVRAMAEETFSGISEYRFFYRELGALTRRDPELARRFRELRLRGIAGTEDLLRTFVQARVLVGLEDEAAVSRLAKALVLMAEFWLPFEETGSGTPEGELASEGANLMMQLLEPLLADGEFGSVDDRGVGTVARDGNGGGR